MWYTPDWADSGWMLVHRSAANRVGTGSGVVRLGVVTWGGNILPNLAIIPKQFFFAVID